MTKASCILCGTSILLSDDEYTAARTIKSKFIENLIPEGAPSSAEVEKVISDNEELVVCKEEPSCGQQVTEFLEANQKFLNVRDDFVEKCASLFRKLLLQPRFVGSIIGRSTGPPQIEVWCCERIRSLLLNKMPVMPDVNVGTDLEGVVLEKRKKDLCSLAAKFAEPSVDLTKNLHTNNYNESSEPINAHVNATYDCSLCSKKFDTKQALSGHQNLHCREGNFTCGQCTQTFASGKLLSRHLKHHKRERTSCSLCRRVLPNKSLFDHLLLHQNDKKYTEVQCSVCRKNFKSPLWLAYHYSVHQGRYSCVVADCKKTYMSRKELIAHKSTHSEQNGMVQCDFCDLAVTSKGDLDTHLQVFHKQLYGSCNFLCTICDKNFGLAPLLRIHMREEHNVDKTDYKCKVCSKVFSAKSSLMRHEKYHEEEPLYQCADCNKFFRQKGIYEAHLRKHTGVNSHTCQYCEAGFSEVMKLRQHVWLFHRTMDDFTCNVCYKSYDSYETLKKHMDDKHEKLRCKICSRQFKYSTHLKEHLIRRHAPVRPYTCPASPTRGFVRHSQLENHMKKNHPHLPIPEIGENVTFVVEIA